MGIIVISFAILAIIMGIGIFIIKHDVHRDLDKHPVAVISSSIFGFLAAVFLATLIYMCGEYGFQNYCKQNKIYEGEKIERLLKETYNIANLQNALDFNLDQKTSANYNKGWLLFCLNFCYVADTIAIPDSSYMPKSGLSLNNNANLQLSVTNK